MKKYNSKLIFTLLIFQTILYGQNVKVDCNSFKLNGQEFKSIGVNYLMEFRKNYNSSSDNFGNYYITATNNYSSIFLSSPPTGLSPYEELMFSEWGGRWDIGDETACLNKIKSDFSRFNSNGINTLRIVGIAPKIEDNLIVLPTDTYQEYFQLLDQLFDLLSQYNLKANLLLGIYDQWDYPDIYMDFLDKISNHLKDKEALLAYELFNEPFWRYKSEGKNDKYKISCWVDEWLYTIKNNDTKHLVTIGVAHPETVKNWDPNFTKLDFHSFHFYGWSKDVNISQNAVNSMAYWVNQYIDLPWIVGETGYSGTSNSSTEPRTGSEFEQLQYAINTYKRCLDCGSAGYTWWQYQEVHWDDDFENYLGLVTYYPTEDEKLVLGAFPSMSSSLVQPQYCIQPTNFFNLRNFPYLDFEGTVLDEKNNPIEGAVITGTKYIINEENEGEYPYYVTFSDENGNFKLHSELVSNYIGISVSHAGYSVVSDDNPQNLKTYKIQKEYNNNWSKRFTNDGNNKIGEWAINNSDLYYVGDFDGDEIEEILFVQSENTDKGLITLQKFINGKWVWIWSNNGNNHPLLPYKENLVIGDFDGNGADEILGDDINGWTTLFKFQNDDFEWTWSDNGNSQHALRPYKGNLIAGDFDGNGVDEILGDDINGWTTLFKFQNDDFEWTWSDNGNSQHALRPYKGNLIVGNFDGNGADEILGDDVNGWTTLFKFQNDDFEWTWSDNGNSQHALRPYKGNLIVGNFDEDKADEILGLATWATKFDFGNNDFNWSWSTNNSKKFSDYSVDKDDKMFFFKSNLGPEYLLILNSGLINSQKANIYTFHEKTCNP